MSRNMNSALFHRVPILELSAAGATVIRQRKSRESGIALVMALLLLILMSILGLGMVLSVNSEALINGYYGSYRSSYYAADSGLNIARQQLANQVTANVSTASCVTWGAASNTGNNCTAYPISSPATAASNALSFITSNYGGSFHPLNLSGTQAANSWPGSFEITGASTFTPTFTPSATCGTTSNPCVYSFTYSLVSAGKGPGFQQVTNTETGKLLISVTANTGASNMSFNQFGAFIHNFNANSSPLVYGTITGPQWTNGSWNFGSGGNYVFTGQVGQSGPTISYDFSGCGGYCYVDSAGPSASNGGTTIAPTFQQGPPTVGAPAAPLPTDDYSQKWAVLDGYGCNEGSNVCGNPSSPNPPNVTNANLNAALQNINGTAYPSSGTSSGVYLPYSGVPGSTSNPPTMNGGGIYVEGSVTSVLLTPGTDTGGNPTQIYTIVQNGTTTTITTNIAANSTTMVSGGTTTKINGVPRNFSTGASSPPAQTMLYVDGNIGAGSGSSYTGISGPGENSPAIQNGVQLTVVANGNINLVGNILYQTSPVTLNTSDSLVPANVTSLNGAVFGMYTQSGNLNLYSPYSDNNLQIDGAIAEIGNSCSSNSCGLETLNNINTLTIVGGRSEGYAHGVNMNAANTYYDQRFAQPYPNTVAPPWFPSTTVTYGVPSAPTVSSTISRLNWYSSPQN